MQSAREFTTADQFEDSVVRHIETTLARSLYNCDEQYEPQQSDLRSRVTDRVS